MLVDEGTHQRVPKHVDEAHHKKHGACQSGRFSCVTTEHIDISVEEQQIHTDSLVDEVLGQVARTETDALHP